MNVGRASPGKAWVPRRIALRIDPSRARRFHQEFAARLAHDLGAKVTMIRGEARSETPTSIELLFDLERLCHRVRGPKLVDRLQPEDLALTDGNGDVPDWLIDFCDGKPPASGRTIRILYDGSPDECALLGALFAGRMPAITLSDAATGAVIAEGVPCADNAVTVLESLDCVFARVMTLATAAARGAARMALPQHADSAARPARLRDAVLFEAKNLSRSIARRLYLLCCHSPHWRTCWRFLQGPDLWQSRSLAGTTWQIIPDPGFRFYADPFPFIHASQAFVFVEDFDHRTQKGVIAVVRFDENGPSGPPEPVLEEPWHLSYPFVFEAGGQVWMIPEGSADRTVALYRAETFPRRWVREAILLDNINASDATLVRHNGLYWLFAATRDGAGSWSDTLSIFWADDFRGPWTPHAGNPVLVDQTSARPAGAIVARGGKLWRPVQDCTEGYGTGIGLAEIITLDRERYEQKVHATLRPDARWPGRRLHTLNRAGRLECIDGSAYSPRSRQLARWIELWSGRREQPRTGP